MATHGKKTYLAMDNAAGTLTALTGIANDSKMSESVDTAETTHYGLDDKTYLAGLSDASGSWGGQFDATVVAWVRAAMAAIKDGSVDSLTLEYGPAGNGSGAPKYTLEIIPTSLEIGAPVGDLVSVSMNWQRTGPTVDSTF